MHQTTKQMMETSLPFKILFIGTIAMFTAAIILSIVFPLTKCNETATYGYHSCSWYFGSNYYYQCYSGSSLYCCTYGFYSCGDQNCRIKPTGLCWGIIIAAWALYGLSFFGAIAVFVIFRHFRQRSRDGAYINILSANVARIAPVYGNNIILYSQPVVNNGV